MKEKILLMGTYLDCENRGVSALGVGALTILNNEFPDKEIVVVNSGQREHKDINLTINSKNLNIKMFFFSSYKKTFFELLLYKFLRIKPETEFANLILESNDNIFQVNQGDSFSDIYGLKRLFKHFKDSLVAFAAGKNIIFLPQTIGPFKTLAGKLIGAFTLKMAKKVYVRDDKCNHFLDKIGVKYTLTPDMAVFMSPAEANFNINNNTIGININGLMYYQNYASLSGQFNEYKNLINKLVQNLLDNNHNILLVPHTYSTDPDFLEDDLRAIQEIYDQFSHDDRISMVDRHFNAQELKNIISKLDFFIGSRMHSCIAALSSSVPTAAYAYSYKFDGTFRHFEQNDLVIKLNNINSESISNIIEKTVSFIKEKESIREKLSEVNSSFEQIKIKS